jgi:hypothetical protein
MREATAQAVWNVRREERGSTLLANLRCEKGGAEKNKERREELTLLAGWDVWRLRNARRRQPARPYRRAGGTWSRGQKSTTSGLARGLLFAGRCESSSCLLQIALPPSTKSISRRASSCVPRCLDATSLCLARVWPPVRLLSAIEVLWTRNMRVPSEVRHDGCT